MARKLHFAYALSFAHQSPTQTMLEGEQFRCGIQDLAFSPTPQAHSLPGQGGLLTLGPCEKILSHLSCRDKRLTVRLYDVSGKKELVSLSLPGGKILRADYVDLLGNALGEVAMEGGQLQVSCPAHKIVTLRLEIQ